MKGKVAKILFTLMLITGTMSSAVFAEDCDEANRLLDDATHFIEYNLPYAESKLSKAVSLCERSASLNYNYGVVLYSSGKFDKAQRYLDEALRLKPSYAKAMSTLAAVLFEKKDQEYTRSVQLARQAVQLEPNSRTIKDTRDKIEAFVDVPYSTNVSNDDAIAVVIGNKNYASEMIPAVEYADRDAEIMKKYLIKSLGFREKNIIFRKDAKFTELFKVFGDSHDHKGLLYNYAKQGKSDIFIFYSGHGVPDSNTKKAYIAPSDMDPNAIKHSSYPLDQLYENLGKLAKEKQTKSVTIVLDACFSGASERGMIIQNASPIFLEPVKSTVSTENLTIMTSSKGDQISSWYPEQKHGIFTYHFLKAIRDIMTTGKPLTVAGIEQKLVGIDGVNDTALRLHNREQMPQCVGDKSVQLATGI
jgi:tetratricopeptide (TPR) repeat protein